MYMFDCILLEYPFFVHFCQKCYNITRCAFEENFKTNKKTSSLGLRGIL